MKRDKFKIFQNYKVQSGSTVTYTSQHHYYYFRYEFCFFPDFSGLLTFLPALHWLCFRYSKHSYFSASNFYILCCISLSLGAHPAGHAPEPWVTYCLRLARPFRSGFLPNREAFFRQLYFIFILLYLISYFFCDTLWRCPTLFIAFRF